MNAEQVNEAFLKAFGRTPLSERLDDIQTQTTALTRYRDIAHLKEETGDLLASVIQLANESGWNIDDLLNNTLNKIATRLPHYNALGRKKQIALLGSACNPPTNGHIAVAQYVLDTSKSFDEVWLMPCFQHMNNKAMAPSDIRLEMCRAATKVDNRIKVFDYEIEHQLQGETYFLIKRLLADPKYDQYDFSLIIGMDNALTFDTWVNSKELERIIRFVVVPRPGYACDFSKNMWFMKTPHIILTGGNQEKLKEISSTQIRQWLKENNTEKLTQNIHPEVYNLIQKYKLYN